MADLDRAVKALQAALDVTKSARVSRRSGDPEVIERAVGKKWAGHQIGQVDFIQPERSMSQIGG